MVPVLSLADQFNQMCPHGRGNIPSGDSLYGPDHAGSYKGETKLLPHRSHTGHTSGCAVFDIISALTSTTEMLKLNEV